MLDDLPLPLDRSRATPLAVQLAEGLRAAAADGRLRAGDRLPATRRLAATLGVSRTVTAAAYEQLQAEGWIAGRHGSGTFVTAAPDAVRVAPTAAAVPPVASPVLADLRTGTPWAAGLGREVWRRAWRAGADGDPLARPERTGLPEFRAAVSEHLLRHRGLAAGPDAVLATGGTTAGLLEVASAMWRPGEAVAVEEPGYPRAVGALRAAGLRVLPVPVDAEGLLVDALPSGIRGVYCTPAHQFPMGTRLSAVRRVALVRRARRDGLLVVEDDYDGELRYDVAPLPLLAALAPDVVAHLGTTSKILTPTLGVGWMVAPPEVAAAVLGYRAATGTGPAPAGQRLLVALAATGDLARHLRRVRRELTARRDLLSGALRSAGLEVLGDRAGAHVVVPVGGVDAERAVIAAAAERGLLLDGLARCHAGPPERAGVTVGYAAVVDRAALAAVLPRLGSLLRSVDAGRE